MAVSNDYVKRLFEHHMGEFPDHLDSREGEFGTTGEYTDEYYFVAADILSDIFDLIKEEEK